LSDVEGEIAMHGGQIGFHRNELRTHIAQRGIRAPLAFVEVLKVLKDQAVRAFSKAPALPRYSNAAINEISGDAT
jgi:hypothetical protein